MTEKTIMTALHEGSEEAITACITQYLPLAHTVVSARTATICNKEDIEDCVSEVFLALWRRRKTLDPAKGTVKAYLCAIASYKATELYRKQSKHQTLSIDETDVSDPPDSFTPEEELLRQEKREALFTALDALGDPDREIVIRRHFLQEPSKTVAKRLNMTVSAVDTRIHRALKKLKERLGENER